MVLEQELLFPAQSHVFVEIYLLDVEFFPRGACSLGNSTIILLGYSVFPLFYRGLQIWVGFQGLFEAVLILEGKITLAPLILLLFYVRF